MHIYAFELGHQPHLSQQEIFAVFQARRIAPTEVTIHDGLLFVTLQTPLDAQELMDQLGGTKKIIEKIEGNGTVADQLYAYLSELDSSKKIHFSLHASNADRIAIQTKKRLKELGRSVRYVKAKNTATILHNNLVEKGTDITIIGKDLFVTRAIQPIEAMRKRDFDRPKTDAFSGMLPPKLARMMINLSGAEKDHTLLDPFCGSGTVLMEAIDLGFANITGSDLSQKAVDDSIANTDWMKREVNSNTATTIFLADAQQLDKQLEKESVDIIVSEPYMGKPLHGNEKRMTIEQQAQELARLYTNAFSAFYKILTPGATAIFIIPKFRHKDDWITIDCVPDIKQIGFEVLPFSGKHKTLLYWRTDQHVGREIWQFKKK